MNGINEGVFSMCVIRSGRISGGKIGELVKCKMYKTHTNAMVLM